MDLHASGGQVLVVEHRQALGENPPQVGVADHLLDRPADDVVVMLGGRVDMKKYRWRPGLDELLWKPTARWDEE